MSWNGSGLFNIDSTGQPVSANTLIESADFNALTDDLATGLSNCVTKDGQQTITANLPMAGFRHTGVGNAAARTDYAAAGQVQDGKLNWVDGGGTADAITATYSPTITALVDGQLCCVRATAANTTTTPTFAPNGLTARTIVKKGGAALVAGDIVADGHELILRYDLTNTRWELLNPGAYAASGAATSSGLTMATSRLLGRTTASTGAIEEISVSGATLSGGVLTIGLPRSYLAGLGMANGTDATNDIDIAVGTCRDSTNAADITLGSVITKQLDAAWAVGTNQGGLDTGSIANTTYHVWLIKRSDTGVVDALFSTSATAPTMPANYDYKRRIGSIMRASAAIRPFLQVGNTFTLKSPPRDVSTANPGTSAILSTLSLPVGIKVEAILNADLSCGSLAGTYYFLLSDPDTTDNAPSSSNIGQVTGKTSAGFFAQQNASQVRVFCNTSAQVRYRLSQSDATTAVNIMTSGFVDRRDA